MHGLHRPSSAICPVVANRRRQPQFGKSVFDAGDFHVGFGIAVPSDEETTDALRSATRSPLRFTTTVLLAARRSLQRSKTPSLHCLRGWLNRGRAPIARLAPDQHRKKRERGNASRSVEGVCLSNVQMVTSHYLSCAPEPRRQVRSTVGFDHYSLAPHVMRARPKE
jgi:hypothetical protein